MPMMGPMLNDALPGVKHHRTAPSLSPAGPFFFPLRKNPQPLSLAGETGAARVGGRGARPASALAGGLILDDSTKALLTGVVRHVLTIAAGALAAHGFSVDDGTTQIVAGAIVAIIGVVWSGLHKKGVLSL